MQHFLLFQLLKCDDRLFSCALSEYLCVLVCLVDQNKKL